MHFVPKTLGEIATHVGGMVEGDPGLTVHRVVGIEDAGAGDLTFLANPRYAKVLHRTQAAAVIVSPRQSAPEMPLIRVENPYLAFAKALELMTEAPRPPAGIHAGAFVEADARVAPDCTLMPGSYVGERAVLGAGCLLYPGAVVLADARVGADSVLYPGVVVGRGCALGERVIVQPGAVIGGDGYGFARDDAAPQGQRHYKIRQVGTVVIEDDVEIGAGTCIDRGAVGETRIGRGTKIDNLVMIGHGCRIGPDTLIVAQSGLAGSVQVGAESTLAARAGVLGHLQLGPRTLVYSRAHVTKSTPPDAVVSGNPARPHRRQLRQEALTERLERLYERVAELEARLGEREDDPA